MMGLTRFDPTPDPLPQHIPLSPCCFQGRVYCNYPRTGYFPFSDDLPQTLFDLCQRLLIRTSLLYLICR